MSHLERFFVRITDRLYGTYTGQVGAYTFKDGKSITKMHRNDAINFSHGFPCEALDDEGNVMFAIVSGKVPTDTELQTAKTTYEQAAKVETKAVEKQPAKVEAKVEAKAEAKHQIYTREELEAIADKQGLRGLREVAAHTGAKAKSIPTLIEKILEKQV